MNVPDTISSPPQCLCEKNFVTFPDPDCSEINRIMQELYQPCQNPAGILLSVHLDIWTSKMTINRP